MPDQAWKALTLVNDWVKHAETKSAATLAGAGVVGGVLYNLVKNQTHPGVWLSIAAVGCGATTVMAALAALAALAPQLTIPTKRRWSARRGHTTTAVSEDSPAEQAEAAQVAGENDPTNLLFFGDIARRFRTDVLTYTDVLAALTADSRRLTEQIARQVHANSLVAHRKYTLANKAIQALRVALILLALTAIIVGKP